MTELLTLFPVDVTEPVPGRSRRSDPITSHLASREVTCVIKHGSQRFLMLRAFASAGTDGFTDEQAGQKCHISRVADTRRASELRRANLIVPTGKTAKTSTGCEAMKCRVTRAGLDALLAAKR